MTKNSLKSKKAISPILATLLLIVIAVAAIVVTYAWIMTYMTSAG
ncbi:MAG: archaellin/type IV pilin N-terminal domain-containing protein, partial [Candidatus Bathycorpusculaceae bacterium]